MCRHRAGEVAKRYAFHVPSAGFSLARSLAGGTPFAPWKHQPAHGGRPSGVVTTECQAHSRNPVRKAGREVTQSSRFKPFGPKGEGRMKTARTPAGVARRGTGERTNVGEAQPLLGQRGQEIQPFGAFVRMPLGLSEAVCQKSATLLNQILADSISLRDLYKKHHWQVAGPTFYQLHLLFDKHAQEQSEIIDELAERIQTLGGISVAMAHDVAELT